MDTDRVFQGSCVRCGIEGELDGEGWCGCGASEDLEVTDVVAVGISRVGHEADSELRAWRQARGWTQERAAVFFGVTARTVSRWETKGKHPHWADRLMVIS